jgi:hypothetical protein
MEFSHKIIAYLDILGWKQLVKSAEDGTGPPLAELCRGLSVWARSGSARSAGSHRALAKMVDPSERLFPAEPAC